ncbi:uncharacterized protein V1518DRAFT_242880 [Limtongia smithiae]|uniref:uncharacterized protein n=1 Tax=Limtongia smithiae TaxID=1125753 RepID=UPI0034CD0BE9
MVRLAGVLLIALHSFLLPVNAIPSPVDSFFTPAAYISYELPKASTPYDVVAAPWSGQTSSSPVFSVLNVSEPVQMRDSSNEWDIYRDGGGSCSLANTTFFVFCDTGAYNESDELVAFASNSLSVVTDFEDIGELADATMVESVQSKFAAIPFTTNEAKYNDLQSTRYALWTYTNCIQINSSYALHFWGVHHYYNSTTSHYYGNTLSIYTLDEATNNITVARPFTLAFTSGRYPYGSFANLVVDDYVYLYATDSTYSDNYDIHVARCPKDSILDFTTCAYYDAAEDYWSSTIPVPTGRRQSAAIITNGTTFSSGSMYYSEYHQAYVLIYFSNMADNLFRLISSPTPLGPWNVTDTVLYNSTEGPLGYNYGGVAHPIYYQTDDQVAGQSVMLHYSYQDTNGTYPLAVKLEFE